MEPFGVKATLMATAVATLLAVRAQRKKSLTKGGSIAAFCVGFSSVWTGLRGFNILVFYQIGTSATKYKKNYKATMDGTVAATGSIARGASQVLACSLLAVILSLIHAVHYGRERPINYFDKDDYLASCLTCGIVAHYATCLADTLASELGILSKSSPVLITQPWRKVPSGTNGGVTLMGFVWSALGGLLIGLSTILFDYLSGLSPLNIAPMLSFATACGLVGSVIDSLLGATVQQTYWDPDTKLVYQGEDKKPASAKLITGTDILNNEQVNMVSVALTTFVGGWFLGPMFFGR
jgi:uncharacterized protein (TIGR00297 family)